MAYDLDFSINLGPGAIGITDLRAQFVDSLGVNVGAPISSGFVEIGSGYYLWHATGIDRSSGGVKFYAASNPSEIIAFSSYVVGLPPTVSEIASAVWSSASRTLTSFGALAASIWTHATRTLTNLVAGANIEQVSDSGKITVHRGDTLNVSFTNLGSVASRSKLWFTVKSDLSLGDDKATIALEETAGLTVVNGVAHTNVQDGSITVIDADDGILNIVIAPSVTSALEALTYYYDVQVLISGVVRTLTSGTMRVNKDVTKSIS